MLENKEQFYLYDRWFYLLKENDEKIEYTSGIKDSLTGIIIEYYKETKEVNILYLQDKVLISKLSITDISSNKMKIHYQDQEAQQIIINNHTYVNLLIEFFTTIENQKLGKKKVKINKKKKMNKICYFEPNFPIDKEIDLKSIDIESDVFSYFLGLITHLKGNIDKIEKCVSLEPSIIDEKENIVTNLNIPNEIEIYDRVYSFVKNRDNVLYYINEQDGIHELELGLDYCGLQNILLSTKEDESSKKSKYYIKFINNEIGGITVKFANHKKSTMIITASNGTNSYDDAKFKVVTAFDKDNKKALNNIEISVGNEEYILTHHPYISHAFIDEYGNDYRISSSDFSRLEAISDFGPNIFNYVKTLLIKK